jgi:hypothetical protein
VYKDYAKRYMKKMRPFGLVNFEFGGFARLMIRKICALMMEFDLGKSKAMDIASPVKKSPDGGLNGFVLKLAIGDISNKVPYLICMGCEGNTQSRAKGDGTFFCSCGLGPYCEGCQEHCKENCRETKTDRSANSKMCAGSTSLSVQSLIDCKNCGHSMAFIDDVLAKSLDSKMHCQGCECAVNVTSIKCVCHTCFAVQCIMCHAYGGGREKQVKPVTL